MDNKVSKKGFVTEKESGLPENRLFATTRAFLETPNPAIFKVFVLSSFPTFDLGIALALEWISHGKNHAGFEWIIFYALFLICLPLLILIGLHILMAISSSSRGSNQIADKAKEACNNDVSKADQTVETERNSCRSIAIVEEKIPRIKHAVSFPSSDRGVRSCRTR